MPDLTLNADTTQYKELAGEFATNEIASHSAKFDTSKDFPDSIAGKAFEVGLLNGRLPEDLGGLGLSIFDACVIAEEIGKACAGIGAAFWGGDLGLAPLLVAGNDQQRQRFLKPLSDQYGLAAACFDEPDITYVQSGGKYLLNGTACLVNATHGKFVCVPARAQKGNGVSAFIVPLDQSGIVLGDSVSNLGLRAADLRLAALSDVALESGLLVGTEYGGKQVFCAAATISLPIVASYAAGISAAALQHSVRYAQERQTMGTVIANHQAVAFMLADMARQLEASRFLIRKAAWLADHGQGELPAALMAREFSCSAAMQAATDAVQVFGGYGYSKEYPVEKLMRDAKMLQLFKPACASDCLAIAESVLAKA
jgi:acyl-CoA dehydrogenase